MKRIILLLLALITVLSLCACGKRVNPADFDEGPDIDAGISSETDDTLEGDPYGNSEIGLTRAYHNLINAFGDYDEHLKLYTRYSYQRDDLYNGAPCYIYSRMVSKTENGEYKHRDYVAVYKDGSRVEICK